MPASADRLTALIDIRSPDATISALAADAALAFAIGVALALLVALTARLVMRRPPSPWETAAEAIGAARTLDAEERALALARALSQLAADVHGAPISVSAPDGGRQLDECLGTTFFTNGAGATFATTLYRPGADDLDPVEREVLRLVARRGR